MGRDDRENGIPKEAKEFKAPPDSGAGSGRQESEVTIGDEELDEAYKKSKDFAWFTKMVPNVDSIRGRPAPPKCNDGDFFCLAKFSCF